VFVKVLSIAESLERHVFIFWRDGNIVGMRRGGIFGIVVGEVIVIGGDVSGVDWEGDVDAVSSLVEGVVVVVVIVLG